MENWMEQARKIAKKEGAKCMMDTMNLNEDLEVLINIIDKSLENTENSKENIAKIKYWLNRLRENLEKSINSCNLNIDINKIDKIYYDINKIDEMEIDYLKATIYETIGNLQRELKNIIRDI